MPQGQLNWASASTGSAEFIPSLKRGFGWGGGGHRSPLGRAKAGRPSVASSGIQGWAEHRRSMSTRQGFGVSVCLLLVFLDLRRGKRAHIMTPLCPFSFAPLAARSSPALDLPFFLAFISI